MLYEVITGDWYPSAEWRRAGLYHPSMNSKIAMRASALVSGAKLDQNGRQCPTGQGGTWAVSYYADVV